MLTPTKCENLPCRKLEPWAPGKPRGIQVCLCSPATLTALLQMCQVSWDTLPWTRAAPLLFGKALVIIDLIL